MKIAFQTFLAGLIALALAAGCRGTDNKSSNTASSSGTFACSYKKEGNLTLCNQYQDLSGTTLTQIQSECELKAADGYSWAVASCPDSTVGTCALAATSQKPAPSVQYYYGATFSSAGTAAGMCGAQDGTFK